MSGGHPDVAVARREVVGPPLGGGAALERVAGAVLEDEPPHLRVALARGRFDRDDDAHDRHWGLID